MEPEPVLTVAALTHHLVADLLSYNGFDCGEFPEIIDLAVVMTGLGLPRSQLSLVQKSGPFWDSTFWMEMPRPFLDAHGLAYVFAVAAWFRGEKQPAWVAGLAADVRKPTTKSIKFLISTKDSFLNPTTTGNQLLNQGQPEWLKMAAMTSVTNQIVAVRHLSRDETIQDQQSQLLSEKLQSSHRSVVVNATRTVERLQLSTNEVVEELRFLIDHRCDEVRAKAMIALAKLGQLDESSITSACKMIDSSVNYVAFAGLLALSTVESASDEVLRAAERGFKRSLQTCNYEFVNLYAATFDRWLDDPESHFQELLEHDQPEYLQIALEALASTREPAVPSEVN